MTHGRHRRTTRRDGGRLPGGVPLVGVIHSLTGRRGGRRRADEQLDALGNGANVDTPLRGMLAQWRTECRNGEPYPAIIWTPADGYVWCDSGIALSFDECESWGLDGTARSEPRACPTCGEVIRRVPPTSGAWTMTAAGQRARWSHLDGEPVCPRVGPDGYEPDEPEDV